MARAALLLALPLFLGNHGGKVNWIHDGDAGMAQAQTSGRFALLYFTASW